MKNNGRLSVKATIAIILGSILLFGLLIFLGIKLMTGLGEDQIGSSALPESSSSAEAATSSEAKKRLCTVLDEVGNEIDPDLSTLVQEGITEETDLQGILQKTLTLLSAREDVEDAWIAGDSNVRFTTTDHLAGGFSYTINSDDPDKYHLGSASANGSDLPYVMSSSEELQPYFEYDDSFSEVAIDPDVLVVTPLKESDLRMKAICAVFENAGKETARTLGGSCTIYNEGTNSIKAIKEFTHDPLSDYGTILILTHGLTETRADGSKLFGFIMYQSTYGENGQMAWDVFGNDPDLPDDAFVDSRFENGSKEATNGEYSYIFWDIWED